MLFLSRMDKFYISFKMKQDSEKHGRKRYLVPHARYTNVISSESHMVLFTF